MSKKRKAENVTGLVAMVSQALGRLDRFLVGVAGWPLSWYGYRITTDKPVAEIKRTGNGVATVSFRGSSARVKLDVTCDSGNNVRGEWYPVWTGSLQFRTFEKAVGWRFGDLAGADKMMHACEILPGCDKDATLKLLQALYGRAQQDGLAHAKSAGVSRQIILDWRAGLEKNWGRSTPAAE